MSKKATRERQFRQRELQKKHFNVPMCRFLEAKYPKIYGEYRQLYDLLNRNHPYTRDLTKTCTFKAWLCTIERQPTTAILSDAIKEPLNEGETSRASNEIIETGSDQNNNQVHEAAEQVTGETANDQNDDPLPETASQIPEETSNNDGCSSFEVIDDNETSEAAPTRVSMSELVDIMVNVEEQVDDLMNELRQDQTLRNILDQPEDEGIEINPLDDIEYDIEPLDFNIEVENYTW